MLVRNCAGGIVFLDRKVFLLKNEKDEWVFPKGVVRNGQLPGDVALNRVREEAGIDAKIISTAGQTSYEFFSVTRQKPVCNRITWYLMNASDDSRNPNYNSEKFKEGTYMPIEKAMEVVTYSQDKSLLNLSYAKYREIVEQGTLL